MVLLLWRQQEWLMKATKSKILKVSLLQHNRPWLHVTRMKMVLICKPPRLLLKKVLIMNLQIQIINLLFPRMVKPISALKLMEIYMNQILPSLLLDN